MVDAPKPLAWRAGDGVRALVMATAVVGAWAALLVSSLATPWGALAWWEIALRAVVQTWLYTGLFITAHDAMHGALVPSQPRVNHALGALAVGLYALFPYRVLLAAHQRHHKHPASADDPDWCDPAKPSAVRWYLRFVGHYVRWPQIVGMAVIFNVLQHGLGVDQRKLLLLWVLPSLASTVQLFYFGTYLPHRDRGDFRDAHRARSNAYGTLASLVTCFHFGYHWEHHERPGVPWWRLPEARRMMTSPPAPLPKGQGRNA